MCFEESFVDFGTYIFDELHKGWYVRVNVFAEGVDVYVFISVIFQNVLELKHHHVSIVAENFLCRCETLKDFIFYSG